MLFCYDAPMQAQWFCKHCQIHGSVRIPRTLPNLRALQGFLQRDHDRHPDAKSEGVPLALLDLASAGEVYLSADATVLGIYLETPLPDDYQFILMHVQ